MSSCRFAYLNPPWWVTMGYARRVDFQGHGPAASQPPVGPDQPPPVVEQPPPNQPPPVVEQPPPDQPPPVVEQPPPDQPPPVVEQPPPDQPPPVVDQSLIIAGTVSILQTSGLTAAAGATVEARHRTDDSMAAITTTDATGNFSLTVPTGGVPFDGYLALTISGLLPTRVYVSKPLRSSIHIGNVFLTAFLTLAGLCQLFGVTLTGTQDTVIVSPREPDLSAVQVDGVTVSQGSETVGYVFDPSSLGNYGTGIWVLNVPPGATEVSAVSQGWILGSATIVTMPLTFLLLIADQIVPSSGRLGGEL
jgi:hypothetical protein